MAMTECNRGVRLSTALRKCRANTWVKILVAFASPLLFLACELDSPAYEPTTQAPPNRPNILIVVADDLGYSDLSMYGGEINTPTLASLAAKGITLTSFYTSPSCSPTRAMLLTGVDHHQVGLGTMAETRKQHHEGLPGYQGTLRSDVETLARTLGENGYATYMAGKWHLGDTEASTPGYQGFQRSFALMEGLGSHFNDKKGYKREVPVVHYQEDGEAVGALPEDFYSSEFYADKVIEYIDEGENKNQPFFAYLAFTAPHWPLHVPDEYANRYKGVYDIGWDEIKRNRLARMQQLKLVDSNANPFPRPESILEWGSLAELEQRNNARKMELYAAMVEHMDQQLGRVIEFLETTGRLEETFILFMSDNGPASKLPEDFPGNQSWIPENFDNSFSHLGTATSHSSVGPGWAHVSAAPFRMQKAFVTEGGIRVPAIISSPSIEKKGSYVNSVVHVTDVYPTVLELVGIAPSATVGQALPKYTLAGKSLVSMLGSRAPSQARLNNNYGWELFDRRAYREDEWKIVWMKKPYGVGQWQLFNLSTDLAELTDLSKEYPAKLAEMELGWDRYRVANSVHVFGGD